MSPRIEISARFPDVDAWEKPKVIGDFPDEPGTYQTTHGEVDIQLDLQSKPRQVTLRGEFLKGERRK